MILVCPSNSAYSAILQTAGLGSTGGSWGWIGTASAHAVPGPESRQPAGGSRGTAPLSRSPPSGADRVPPAAAAMLLPRAGGAAGRASPPLAALCQVLRLERSRRTAIVFPLQKLERYLAPGTDTAPFRLFQPGLAALQRAEALFRSDPGHSIDYVSSAVRMDHAPPPALPEVRRALPPRPGPCRGSAFPPPGPPRAGLSCGGKGVVESLYSSVRALGNVWGT